MKGPGDWEVKHTNRLIVYMLLALAGMLLSGCVSHAEPVDYEAILSRVHEGDERERVLRALSDAWYHSECRYPSGAVQDIFLYGPKDRGEVTIVAISSKLRDGQLIVDHLGTFESYFLDIPGYFAGCEPPLKDAFER